MAVSNSSEVREKMIEKLCRLENLCLKFKRNDLAERVSSLLQKLSNRTFSIAVIGEFNRGKSTFINALLAADPLPVSVRPSTSALTRISYSDKPFAKVFDKDGSVAQIEVKNLSSYSINSPKSATTVHVEVYHPAEILKKGIEFFDTPGINDIGQSAGEIVYGLLPKSDALVFMLDARQPLSGSETDFLKNHILKNDVARLFFVLNKAEQLDDNERKDAAEYVRKKLQGIVTHPRVFMVSSKTAINGRLAKDEKLIEASMIKNFENDLFDFLSKERESHLIKSVSYKAMAAAENLMAKTGAAYFFSDRAAGELNLKIKAFETVVSEVESGRAAAESEIEERFERIFSLIKNDAAASREDFKKKLSEKITDSSDDIDRLKSLILTVMRFERKKWFEAELEKINLLLKEVASFIGVAAFSLTDKIVRFSTEKLDAINSRAKFHGEGASFDILHAGEYNALEILTQLATIIFGANPFVSVAALLGSGMIISKIKSRALKNELSSKINAIADEYFNRAGDEIRCLLEKQKKIYISHFTDFVESYSAEVRSAMNETVIEKKIAAFEAGKYFREERPALDEIKRIRDEFLRFSSDGRREPEV